MTLSSLSNFITTWLGLMKAWAACNSLDWVTWFPLHVRFVYIVYWESQTPQVVYIHVSTLWRPRWNVHWNWLSFDWFVTLLHYLFLNKKYWGFGQTRTTNILSPDRVVVRHVFTPRTTATAPSGLRIAQMSGQFSWTVRSTPRQRAAVLTHEKSRGLRGN